MGLEKPNCEHCGVKLCNNASLKRHVEKACRKNPGGKKSQSPHQRSQSPRQGPHRFGKGSQSHSREQEPESQSSGLAQQLPLPESFDVNVPFNEAALIMNHEAAVAKSRANYAPVVQRQQAVGSQGHGHESTLRFC